MMYGIDANVDVLKKTIETVKVVASALGHYGVEENGIDKMLAYAHFRGIPDFPLKLNKVKVATSPIHGRGVFATQKIGKGEVITLYPGHYISFWPDGKGSNKSVVLPGNLVVERDLKIDNTILNDYRCVMSGHYSIIGDPRIIDKPSFLGHMINDGARGHSTHKKYDRRDCEVYSVVTTAKANALFDDIGDAHFCVAAIAIKDIEIGEEILVPYGYEYWRGYSDREQ